jgi:hypothetical protein
VLYELAISVSSLNKRRNRMKKKKKRIKSVLEIAKREFDIVIGKDGYVKIVGEIRRGEAFLIGINSENLGVWRVLLPSHQLAVAIYDQKTGRVRRIMPAGLPDAEYFSENGARKRKK